MSICRWCPYAPAERNFSDGGVSGTHPPDARPTACVHRPTLRIDKRRGGTICHARRVVCSCSCSFKLHARAFTGQRSITLEHSSFQERGKAGGTQPSSARRRRREDHPYTTTFTLREDLQSPFHLRRLRL